MAKQTFTTGQVLTAAQMTSLQQTAMGGGAATAKTASYVLVADDAGTTVAMNAAGATTITVNTGLFAAGDTVFIQNLGAGACTVTAGTATVATAGSLILPQNDAGILYFTATGAAIFYDYIQAGAVSPLTTKGDLYTFSTSDARLGVGANNTVLTADSAEATGLKWATASASGQNFSLLNSGGTALTGAQSVSVTGISGMNSLYIIVKEGSSASASAYIEVRVNSDSTAANYKNYGWYLQSTTPEGESNEAAGVIGLGRMSNNAASGVSGGIQINGCNTAGNKMFFATGSGSPSGGSAQWAQVYTGVYLGSSTISSVQVRSSTGNLDGGTVFIYGSA